MKFKLLIAISIFTLVALVSIQGYLVYNSYELKKKTIAIDARNAIAKIYNAPQIDSLAWEYRNDFVIHLDSYINKKISNDMLLDSLQKKGLEIQPIFNKLFKEGLDAQEDIVDVKFQNIVSGISIKDSLGNTEILYALPKNDTILLLGTYFSVLEGTLINNSTWQKDHEVVTINGKETFDLKFKTHIYMNILDWNNAIARELATLLILSTLLFAFVVGLLYYSIQNLLKQKRIAEIKTDFINNITHELKTPLSTLNLATNTFTSEYENGEDKNIIAETVAIISRQNKRLQKLIDQVLKSSLGYKQIQIKEESFNVTTFLKDLLNDYKLSIEKDVTISENIESTGVTLVADTFYLSTAIINILNNAIKYGGTEILISYEIDAEEFHKITISDNGIGISPKYQKLIFEKFYRVGHKDIHNYKGLGLGLYYTNQIIKAHEGIITVVSNKISGSDFIIKIPLLK